MVEFSDKEFNLLRDHIKKNYGINLSDEKKTLVYSRLRAIIVGLGLNSFSEYYNSLIADKSGKMVNEFINRITTNHTYFMREKDHFDYFTRTALPEIEQNTRNNDMRIWCNASSSGEEPYTLQILMKEYFANKGKWDTSMIASDISTKVLNIAHRGVYSKEAVSAMPPELVKKYFDPYDEDSYRVKDFIRKEMIFRRINLMDEKLDKIFTKKLHTIFCRNVMIYFDEETRDNLVEKMYNMIEPGGYLFIGHSERLSMRTKFKYIMPAVYKKV
ncbi:MAG: protein-glutamate O-methyltransferase CheR [Defluviitaleaceae bacterium]|nr:protein-glutamate O-methyltransferase CheR [Defluviitaleaceae bacterium]